jgi:hypothetical protein
VRHFFTARRPVCIVLLMNWFSSCPGNPILVFADRRQRGARNAVSPPAWKLARRVPDGALCLSFFLIASPFTPVLQTLSAAPAYVQGNFAVPQKPVLTVAVGYAAAEKTGDLNVVIVGWADTTHVVSSVTDTRGNKYQLAAGPRRQSPLINPPSNFPLSQSIYYAKNIVGGPNRVTVNFNGGTAFPDVRILEYSGIDAVNPIDAAVGAAGNTGNQAVGTSSSGTIRTTNVSDLLVGANTVESRTLGAGSGFTPRLLTSPNGDIAEDRIVAATGFNSARAPVEGPNAGWVMQMVAFRSAINLPPDTTPPSVKIAAPAAGARVSGTITITVIATDSGTGVAAVRFGVDGVPYGTALTTSPYTFTLNTAKFAGGSHTLTASAWDFANNLGSAKPISLTFTSSGNPAATGMWSGLVPLPIVAVDSVLLPNGKILMWDGQSMGSNAIVWNYMTNSVDRVPAPANIFCSGVDQMADGRIFIAGGHDGAAHVGLPVANIFNPSTESWTVLPVMSFPRWYPTATIRPSGNLIVTSGETVCDECDEPVQEIYSPATNSWSQLSGAPFAFPYYPHVYQLADGRVLVPATSEAPIVSEVLDLRALAWTAVGGTAALDGGSSAMYLPSKFLKMGKSVDPDDPVVPSVATAYVLDMTHASPAWRQVASMTFPRTYHDATLLPNGNVLVTGGGTTTNAIDTTHAVLPAEVWSAATQTWARLASMSAPRLYHSGALLLPDGRVLVSGGGRFNDDTEPTDQFSAEFFSPPYLFKGARPTISSAPSQLTYGQNFTVHTPDAARIAKVSLIRFGSVTHDINMSQRFVPLSFSIGTRALTIKAPANGNFAPPGNYMLFLVDSNGIPSVAALVHL